VATAKSHEDLIVWQRANELKLAVYDLVKSGPIVRDSDLRYQLRRSAAAAPRLIAEASVAIFLATSVGTCVLLTVNSRRPTMPSVMA
jgi:23S rRNA-intervening sequence protein